MAAVMLLSCGENSAQKQAEEMLSKAGTCYEQGQYDEALTVIDSLRKIYPNAIDTRKKALRLYQDIELKKAQQELLVTDSLLQAVNHDYAYQQEKVERDKAALRATPEELTMFTQTRMRRDSLRTQTEVLGAKIRYIHKKQKESK
jgi:tetratricopeptide (TPR) repeat protein